jgi:hypothetical protein
MSDDTVSVRADVPDVPDVFEGRYPGAMRFFADPLHARQVAVTHGLGPCRSRISRGTGTPRRSRLVVSRFGGRGSSRLSSSPRRIPDARRVFSRQN